MKRFLQDTCYFIILLVAVNLTFGAILSDNKYYGNTAFEAKKTAVLRATAPYNTFFFGSSRVATGINPVIFDSVMTAAGYTTRSYNMASYGTWFSEDQYLINSFVKELDIRNATIFIELQNLMSVNWDKIDTDKNLYYQNIANYQFVLENAISKDHKTARSIAVDSHFLATYTISGFMHLMNLGKSDVIARKKEVNIDFDARGFRPLLPDTIRSKRINLYHRSASIAFEHTIAANPIVTNQILKMLKENEKRHNHVIFFLTPKNYTKELAATYLSIPNKNKLPYVSFLQFDVLYNDALWAETTHLNIYGSQVYSSFIAEQYKTQRSNSFTEIED